MDALRDGNGTAMLGWELAKARPRSRWRRLERFLRARLKAGAARHPKYRRLQAALSDAIRKGVVKPDGLLPTEAELTDITPFSLGTVQRALKGLVDDGLIARKPGVGTIVVPLHWRLQQPLHTCFYAEDGAALPVFTEVLSRRRAAKDGPWRDYLGPAEAPLAIRRRLDVGGAFAICNVFYLDGARYPAFRDTPKRELNGVNFKLYLAREFSLAITGITHRLSVAPAPGDVAAVLTLAAGTPCLHVRALAHLSERPLYYQEYWIPPGARELVIESAFEQLTEL